MTNDINVFILCGKQSAMSPSRFMSCSLLEFVENLLQDVLFTF